MAGIMHKVYISGPNGRMMMSQHKTLAAAQKAARRLKKTIIANCEKSLARGCPIKPGKVHIG
jgi:hypothetical protein